MDSVFFQDLELRSPDHRLDLGGATNHGEQTAAMLVGIEKILLRRRPSLLLVGGDCNTHLAGALAARKLHVPIGHVEAGMRSYDWRMPEEHNRVMIDHISEHLFVNDDAAAQTLRDERVRGQIHVVGTTIADAVHENLTLARNKGRILSHLGLRLKGYLLATAHRQENVDDPLVLASLIQGLATARVETGLPVVMPVHPRTRKRLSEFGIEFEGIEAIDPLGYLDFLSLLAEAAVVATDSGGVQQEACILGVPCVTIRPSTEWTCTVEIGANRLCDCEPNAIVHHIGAALAAGLGWTSPFSGGAARRLVDISLSLAEEGVR
jgi:UDP-N-acetylglucosamine 2-epimerase (non-hydrolysing)